MIASNQSPKRHMLSASRRRCMGDVLIYGCCESELLLPEPLRDRGFFLTDGPAVDLHHVAGGPAGPALDHVLGGAQLLVLDHETVPQPFGGGLYTLNAGRGHHDAYGPPAGGAAEIPDLFPGFPLVAAALKILDLVHVVELGEVSGGQRHEPVDCLAALQGFEDDAAGSVVDVIIGYGQPLADPAAGVVKQQGEGALVPIVRPGQGAVNGGEIM